MSGEGIIACNHRLFSDRTTAAVALPLIDSQSASQSPHQRGKLHGFSHKWEITRHRMSEGLRWPLFESSKNRGKSKQTCMQTGIIKIPNSKKKKSKLSQFPVATNAAIPSFSSAMFCYGFQMMIPISSVLLQHQVLISSCFKLALRKRLLLLQMETGASRM